MNNIVLIGMPGAGKSTIGVVLAKILGYEFLDSDLLIQRQEKKKLSEIIKEKGIEAFKQIENEVNASIDVDETVIATGGSAIYGKEAMNHLKDIGTVVYLKLPYEELKARLGSLEGRGVVLSAGQTLEELYAERIPYYEEYADITVDGAGKTMEEVLSDLKAVLG